MAYSIKKRRMMIGGALALGVPGIALVFWLNQNHSDPVFVGVFRVALALIVIGLCVRSFFYLDEVQRQAAQKHWFFGSFFGIAAMLPVVVFLQTHKPWLDAFLQVVNRHPTIPLLYFNLGVVIPVMFQAVSVVVLGLLDKLSRSSRS